MSDGAGLVQIKWLRLGRAQRDLQKDMRRLFREQRDVYLQNIKRMVPLFREDERDDAWDLTASATQSAFDAAIQKAALASAPYGFDAVLPMIGVDGYSFDLRNQQAEDYYADYGLQRTALIFETTEKKLFTIISQAIAEGWDYERTAERIRAEFQDFTYRRAKLIAVTEVGNAYEEASRLSIRNATQMGLVFEHRQLTAADDKVCTPCRTNADVGYIPMTESYPFAPPMTHPGCRCTELYRRV